MPGEPEHPKVIETHKMIEDASRKAGKIMVGWDYEKVSAPFKRGGKYYYYKNEGLQDQSVLYSVEKLGVCVNYDYHCPR